MATNTPKLNLVKPETTDPVDIDVLNGNMDILDNALTDSATLNDLSNVSLTSPTAGQKLVFDGTNWVNLTGYQYVQTIYYTSNGTFTKASYPWLRAIRVKVQGAGGGSGGGQATERHGGGGGGGGYAERFFTDIASLSASVTVTRGGGGAGGAAGNNNGSTGGTSEFGGSGDAWRTTAAGGNGGLSGANGGIGGAGGVGQNGDLFIQGSGGGSTSFNSAAIPSGYGGGSVLGGSRGPRPGGVNSSGESGQLYGGGASGALSVNSSFAGATGGNGIVIVELYA